MVPLATKVKQVSEVTVDAVDTEYDVMHMEIFSGEDEPLIPINGVVVDNSTTSTITEQDIASSKFLLQGQKLMAN